MRMLVICLSLSLIAQQAVARTVRAIGVDTVGCCELRNPGWRSDVVFYNPTLQPLIVTLVSMSDGPSGAPEGSTLTLPPRIPVSVRKSTSWLRNGPLWFWTFDVPEEVEVRSELHYGYTIAGGPSPEIFIPAYGQISFPTFSDLTPAHQEKIFLGTDLGDLKRRVNVGVHNPSDQIAWAEVAVRRSCDRRLLAVDVFAVPPRTTVQRVRVHEGRVDFESPDCPTFSRAEGSYVTVTVDRPSLSFVSALSSADVPRLTHNFVP